MASEIVVVGPQDQSNPASDLGAISDYMRGEVRKMKFGREFTLVHVPDQGAHAVLSSREFSKEVTIADMERGCQTLAQQLYDHAIMAMRVHTMPQVFNIVPYDRQHPEKQPMGAFPFRLWPPHANMIGIGGQSESPNEAGISKQAMRLTEVFSGQAYRTTRDGQDLLHKLLDDAREDLRDARTGFNEREAKLIIRVEKLESERDAVIKAREDALDGALARDLKRKAEEQQQANVGRMWNAAFTFGPMLLKEHGLELPPNILSMMSGAGGAGVTPPLLLPVSDGQTPLEKMGVLFASLTQEQKSGIIQLLTQDQARILIDVMILAGKELESGSVKKSANGVTSGTGVNGHVTS